MRAEHEVIHLRRDIPPFKAGTEGTIVQVFSKADRSTYLVEILGKDITDSTLLTVTDDDVE